MASKLAVYNAALHEIGERKLFTLSEARAPRRRLDTVWDSDTGVSFCLQQGLWNFAMETVELTYSPSITPAFGYRYAFDKPTDWVRTARLSDDAQFCNKQFDYEDQGAYWYADTDTIYVKYVSKSTSLGMDLSLWTPNFTRYVELYLASRIAKAETGSSTDRDALMKMADKKLLVARATDAMDESSKMLPAGSWSRARRGGGTRGDGGSNSRLTG